MKTPISLLLVFLVITSAGLSQSGKWERINTRTSSMIPYTYHCISCSDEKNCTAIGYATEIYGLGDPENGYTDVIERTTDGGETWIRQHTTFPKRRDYSRMPFLRKIKMIDSLHAIAVGDSGRIITTSDGGITWIERDSKSKWNLTNVAFYDKANGIAIGYAGVYRITSDGGITWQERPDLTLEAQFIDVEAPAPHTYYIFDTYYTKLLRTFDDGNHWDTLIVFKDNVATVGTNHGKSIYAASFTDTMNGWVVGLEWISPVTDGTSGYIARTQDGGITWNTVWYRDNEKYLDSSTRIPIVNFSDVYTSSLTNCLAIGEVSGALQTNDRGATWTREEFADTSLQETPRSLCAPSSSTAFLVGSTKIFRRQFASSGISTTINNGENQYFWITTTPIPVASLMEVKLYGLFSVKNQQLTVKMYNILGTEVADLSVQANAGSDGFVSKFHADVSKLGTGVYVLQYSAGGYSKSGLFVVCQ